MDSTFAGKHAGGTGTFVVYEEHVKPIKSELSSCCSSLCRLQFSVRLPAASPPSEQVRVCGRYRECHAHALNSRTLTSVNALEFFFYPDKRTRRREEQLIKSQRTGNNWQTYSSPRARSRVRALKLFETVVCASVNAQSSQRRPTP